MSKNHVIAVSFVVAMVGVSCEQVGQIPGQGARQGQVTAAAKTTPGAGAAASRRTKTEPPPAATPRPAAPPKREIASFAAPGLDIAMARKMASALTPLPGVVKAYPKIADKRFEVEFVPARIAPPKILEALQGVSASTEFKGVRSGDPGSETKNRCGGCPMRDRCGKH